MAPPSGGETASSSSPSIDLTGIRHSVETAPTGSFEFIRRPSCDSPAYSRAYSSRMNPSICRRNPWLLLRSSSSSLGRTAEFEQRRGRRRAATVLLVRDLEAEARDDWFREVAFSDLKVLI